MAAQVIALIPDEVLYGRINALKVEVFSQVGEQLYVKDEPHVTLGVVNVNESGNWYDSLEQKTRSLRLKPARLCMDDWILFKDDVITNRHTVACGFDEACVAELKKIQLSVFDAVSFFKQERVVDRYEKMYGSLPSIMRQNVDTYGYPFVGDIWRPHVSVAAIERTQFESVWLDLKQKFPCGQYGVKSLRVYDLNEETDEIRCVREFTWGA